MFVPSQRWILLLIAMATLSGCDLLRFEISGEITDATGGWIGGATVELNGAESQTTTTNGLGEYSFTVHHFGNFEITPLVEGFRFSPGKLTVSTTVPFTSQIGNDFIAEQAPSATPVYQHSGVYHRMRATLSVFEEDTAYRFELFRNGTSADGEFSGCTQKNKMTSVRIPKSLLLAPDRDLDDEQHLHPMHLNPSDEITRIALWRSDNGDLQFWLWLNPKTACPAASLTFDIHPKFDLDVLGADVTLSNFFAVYQEYAGSLVAQSTASQLGIDMTISVYENDSAYLFELFRNGESTGGEHQGCIVRAATLQAKVFKNISLRLDASSESNDLFYPIHVNALDNIVLIAIRERNSDSLQLLIRLHEEIACPSPVLLFDLVPNTKVVAGERLKNFFDRQRDDG